MVNLEWKSGYAHGRFAQRFTLISTNEGKSSTAVLSLQW